MNINLFSFIPFILLGLGLFAGPPAQAQSPYLVSMPTCPSTTVGQTSYCGTIVAHHNAGWIPNPISLGNSQDFYVEMRSPGDFNCEKVAALTSGNCHIADLYFSPKSSGTRSTSVSIPYRHMYTYEQVSFSGSASGVGQTPFSYSWYTSGWSSCSNSCGSGTQSRTVYCRRSDGAQVSDSYCSGSKPARSQNCQAYNGCTYSWQTGSWGSCTGGSGTWQYSAWTPTSGCGTVTQSRTASCVANANSASRTRSVTCRRSDGTTVADSYCGGGKPASSGACTPTSGFSCGTQGPLSQQATLTNTCRYEWAVGDWSAPSSACSESATQTRSVVCKRSDGTTVADSSCGAPKPPTTQTVVELSGCTYSWDPSGFGPCEGGTFSWLAGEWSPDMGCGTVEQTRTVSCAVDAGSGTRAQTVSCRRSDGVQVAEALCDAGSRPATLEACTPDHSICTSPPSDRRTVTLNNSCVRDAIMNVCSEHLENRQFCVATPL